LFNQNALAVDLGIGVAATRVDQADVPKVTQ
jgi:hypothetical protein